MGKSYKLPVLFLTLLILLQVVALEATIVAGSTSSIKEGGMHSLWDYRYVYFSEFPSLSSHRVKVTGRVVDDYGNPLEDADVELISQGVHDFERTDANGRFSFYVYPKEASYWII
ncbi:MAG: carboxypeptidase regulatory-like domain-containing protein, partial [Candidatus Verstraetearchaeota archaeon]|nr:carboxypeptidase regulatory-like domain-containing protein [Candidatus Verstraetearchaeota archaeon]